ncbi:MAG: hypothetical protein ACM3O7_07465 [Acidobacteriota bacterium]
MRRAHVVVLAAVLLAMATPAYAYLDPGAGSVMLQLILGGLAGLAVTVRLFWRRITGRPSESTDPDPSAPDAPARDRDPES